MRCQYCGIALSTPSSDGEGAFCSAAHRMLHEYQRSAAAGNGNGHHDPAAMRELLDEAGPAHPHMAGFSYRDHVPAPPPFDVRPLVAECYEFAIEPAAPASRAAWEMGRRQWLPGARYLTSVPASASPRRAGVRRTRSLRGPGYLQLSPRKVLPSVPLGIPAILAIGALADVSRITPRNRLWLQPRTDRPVSFGSRTKVLLETLGAALRVTDIEPPAPVVADLRSKVAAARAGSAPAWAVVEPAIDGLCALGGQEFLKPPETARLPEANPIAAKSSSSLEALASECLRAHRDAARPGGMKNWRTALIEPDETAVACTFSTSLKPYPEILSRAETPRVPDAACPAGRFHGKLNQATGLLIEWATAQVEQAETIAIRALPAAVEEVGVPPPALPASRPLLPLLCLNAAALTGLSAIHAAVRGTTLQLLEPERLMLEASLLPVAPGLIAPVPRFALEAGTQLNPLLLAPMSSRTSTRIDPQFFPVEAQAVPVPPPLALSGRLAPPLAQNLSRLSQPGLLEFNGRSLSTADLAPAQAEPVRLAPRLEASLIVDEGVAEAVRQYKQHSRRNWLAYLPSLPTLRLPVAKGNLKWALAAAPVVLAVGVFAWRGATNRIALESAPVETATADPAPPPAPAPVAANRKGKPAREIRTITTEAPAPPSAAAAQPAVQPDLQRAAAPTGFLATLKKAILERAAISLADDFRAGLSDWNGSGEWSRHWSYDQAGFLNTGPSVVLYTPSMSLTDYQMNFLGQIERRSLGWVFRARDHRNYQAAKITLTRNGPLPRAVVEHYTVINGRGDRAQSRPLPLEIRTDTLYRVRMDVQGDDFTLSVQGQIVDHWSDKRLPSGGVGFFSARGEQSRLRWIEVSHQSDTLGKLCAFLAPYSLPAREGNQK